MTNWVTIKIPEETRDEARYDPRTYEEIMQAGLEQPQAGNETEQEVYGTSRVEDIYDELEDIKATMEQLDAMTLNPSERKAFVREVIEELR